MRPPVPIDPARELALLLAGTARLRVAHRDRARRVATSVDFAAFEKFVRDESMLGLLGRRLQDLTQSPAWFDRNLEDFERAAQGQSVRQEMLTIQISSTLAHAGIRSLALKGPLLGERIYGNLSSRVSADIDLLVAPSDLRSAERVLATLGYRLDRASELGTSSLHDCMVHPDGLPDIELHWRVHWNEQRFSAGLLSRSLPGPGGCLIPAPADELIELLLLYARDGFTGLRLATDLAAWWDSVGSELDLSAVARLIEEHQPLSTAISTAALTAELLVGLPARQFLPRPHSGNESAWAMRMTNWSKSGSPEQIKANTSLVDWMLTPIGLWPAAARRHLLVPPRRKAALKPARHIYPGWLVLSTAVHIVRLIVRYCIAFLAVARRGAWAPRPIGLEGRPGSARLSGDPLTGDPRST